MSKFYTDEEYQRKIEMDLAENYLVKSSYIKEELKENNEGVKIKIWNYL